jgi:putative oxidoreductase
MQRLFSNFANGWPGLGLLVQRLLIGAALLHYSVAQLKHAHDVAIVIEATAGVLLVIGLWTPIVGALTALTEIWNICWHSGDLWIAIILATAAASLAMIGPGAWSIDRWLFGRKHIDILEQ